jgi:hypothetical protein
MRLAAETATPFGQQHAALMIISGTIYSSWSRPFTSLFFHLSKISHLRHYNQLKVELSLKIRKILPSNERSICDYFIANHLPITVEWGGQPAKRTILNSTTIATTRAMAAPSTLVAGGYHALALPLPHGAFRRFVYAKKHAAKKSSLSAEGGEEPAAVGETLLAADRTVYLVNLPRAATDKWVRESLEPAFGAIQHVVFSSAGASEGDMADPLLGKAAHVVFKAKDAVRKVLSAREIDAEVPEPESGLQGEFMPRVFW